MRIISFSERWPKLQQDAFTTFRFPRRDSNKGRDWAVGERVQIYYKSRSPDRERLGVAEIVGKDSRLVGLITEAEAKEDGFESWVDMARWLRKTHGAPCGFKSMNKLTLRWQERPR